MANVLANDQNPSSGKLQIMSVSNPSAGSVSVSGGAVKYTAPAIFTGRATFTYTVGDGSGSTSTAAVHVDVQLVNHAPSFVAGPAQSVAEDAGPESVSGWAAAISPGATNESAQHVTFTVAADNAALFSVQPALSSDGTLTFKSAANASGSATITVVAHDDGGTANAGDDTSAAVTRTIAVIPVNDAPSFTLSGNQITVKNAGPQTLPGWATNISAGPPDESGQTISFQVTTSNDAVFKILPSISADGTLTFQVHNGKAGTITVTVTALDSGGTANGGQNSSATATFAITLPA